MIVNLDSRAVARPQSRLAETALVCVETDPSLRPHMEVGVAR